MESETLDLSVSRKLWYMYSFYIAFSIHLYQYLFCQHKYSIADSFKKLFTINMVSNLLERCSMVWCSCSNWYIHFIFIMENNSTDYAWRNIYNKTYKILDITFYYIVFNVLLLRFNRDRFKLYDWFKKCIQRCILF